MAHFDPARLFNLAHPIIQAPMVGVSTPELAAAVSNAGGLGSIRDRDELGGGSAADDRGCSVGSVKSQGSLPGEALTDRFSGPRFERSRVSPWTARIANRGVTTRTVRSCTTS